MDTSPDGITRAWLRGAASRHAGWTAPIGPAREAALEELRELAAGRTDLLAEAAGVLRGVYPPEDPSYEHYKIATDLLIEAGADVDQLDRWTQVGSKRRAVPLAGP